MMRVEATWEGTSVSPSRRGTVSSSGDRRVRPAVFGVQEQLRQHANGRRGPWTRLEPRHVTRLVPDRGPFILWIASADVYGARDGSLHVA